MGAVPDAAPVIGLSEEAVSALLSKLEKIPVDKAPSFVERFVKRMIQRGAVPDIQVPTGLPRSWNTSVMGYSRGIARGILESVGVRFVMLLNTRVLQALLYLAIENLFKSEQGLILNVC